MATVSKRGNSYRIRVSLGYDNQGKQVVETKTYRPEPHMSQKQIEKEVKRQSVLFEEECKKNIEKSNKTKDTLAVLDIENLTFAEYHKIWFKNYVELKLKKQTICNYHNASLRVLAAFGDMPLSAITPTHCQKLVSNLHEAGLSVSTIKRHILVLSGVLGYAVKKRLLDYNVASTVDFPKQPRKTKNIYTIEEVKEFLEALNRESEKNMIFIAFFTLAIYTGARRGELLGLTWKDIDFEKHLVSISKAYYYSSYHKENYIDTTKTVSSERTIKISEKCTFVLKKLYQWKKDNNIICDESSYLFSKPTGKIIDVRSPIRFLKTFCKKNGLRETTIHGFRHLAASIMIAEGVDVVSVQSVLGHSSPNTTLNIYSHAFKDAKEKVSVAIISALE